MVDSDPIFSVFETQTSHTSIVEQVTSVIEPLYFAPAYPGRSTFAIEASNVFWTDTRILMRLAFNVYKRKSNGDLITLKEGDKVAICNAFISTCFANLSVSLNGVVVEGHTQLGYPYVSYLQQLLSTSDQYKKEASRRPRSRLFLQ